MRIVRHADLPEHRIPGISHRTLAGEGGVELWHQVLQPGARTPVHSHPCAEVVVVLRGSGVAQSAAGERPFQAGSTLVIPGGEQHELVNTGREELELLAAFPASPVTVRDEQGAAIQLPW